MPRHLAKREQAGEIADRDRQREGASLQPQPPTEIRILAQFTPCLQRRVNVSGEQMLRQLRLLIHDAAQERRVAAGSIQRILHKGVHNVASMGEFHLEQ
jgi:hypothetical protein